MQNKQFYLNAVREQGLVDAKALQTRAAELTGTEVYAEQSAVPDFAPEKQYLNYKEGFVCRSPSGRMVRLVQPYDSTVYTQMPEELPAQWGFYWSQNPEDALPFVAISTSPYMTGDCCTENGVVYRSTIDNNVFPPGEYPQGWQPVTQENPGQ